ncbi:MAG TPA: OmpA family protein [Candidatus Limnocylindria bacterium]|nr:OmpA family protein [Candidatus Limnocylindria bacterium]
MSNQSMIFSVVVSLAFLAAPNAAPPCAAARIDPAAPCYRWPAVDMDDDGVFDRVDHCVSTPAGCTVDAYGCEMDGDEDGVCDGVDQCPGTPPGMKVNRQGCHAGAEEMRESRAVPPSPKELEKQAPRPEPVSRPVSETERQLVERGRIRLENVYFETESAKLLPESETALNEAGEALEKFPDLRIEVEGHSDTRGTARYNQNLSQSRAEAVRSYLVGRFSLRDQNLTAKGYGETRTETNEHNDEELLRNRRVELRVLNPDALPRGVKVENKE